MTWPFENDTSAVVKKYAKKSIKANRRTTLSIMTAILIASTFLCTLCTFVQSYWNQGVQQEIHASGDWDAQLLEVQAGQLPLIQDNDKVQAVMVKGNNQTVQLSGNTELPYLLIQNCDQAYWNTMHEKNLILQGRVPQAPGEIVVGKNFFEQNPTFEIGDTIELNIGERKIGNDTVDFLSPIQTGEIFVKTDTAQYTIVGKIDMTVSSAYNGYPAYGWLDIENIPEAADVVVYLQAKNGFDMVIQQEADQICSAYLSGNDFYTSSKTERAIDRDKLTNGTMVIVYSMTLLFGIVGISSATSAIMNSLYQRRKEFAMLRSVGLDKKGLMKLFYTEALLLAAKPVLIGLPVLLVICATLLWLQDVTFAEFFTVFPSWGLLAYIILIVAVITAIYIVASKKIRKDNIVEVLKDDVV